MAAKLVQEIPLAPVACCTPVAAPDITTDQAETLASIFKALADPHRVRIVNLLANAVEPVCVCDFMPQLGLSQGTVSFASRSCSPSGCWTGRNEGRGPTTRSSVTGWTGSPRCST